MRCRRDGKEIWEEVRSKVIKGMKGRKGQTNNHMMGK
jgi:hypothetical protein